MDQALWEIRQFTRKLNTRIYGFNYYVILSIIKTHISVKTCVHERTMETLRSSSHDAMDGGACITL